MTDASEITRHRKTKIPADTSGGNGGWRTLLSFLAARILRAFPDRPPSFETGAKRAS
jgi:hypothetical protein